jgi:glycosyltransferase involved in cell wall biosynthesis
VRLIERIAPGPRTTAKTHVVHCGIDVAAYNPPCYRAEGGIFTILTAAQLTEKKGHPYLIKACRFLADLGYPFRCIIAGDGPEAKRLQHMVRERGLEDSIVFIGPYFPEQIRDHLHQVDIAVLPCVVASNQDMDGIPNTLMEAMAMEIPVISTTVSGIPELVEDMKTGLLVPPEDDMALANAIILLINSSAASSG